MSRIPMPLEGIRVADFSWVWAGPFCGMLLAALGAEVIKIEGHKRTDMTRHGVMWRLYDPAPFAIPPNQGMSFNSVNMSKKSVTLDLAKHEARELARRLAAKSDVVLDNLRAGAMKRMGLDYESLRKLNPGIIVISVSSRGQEGPQKDYGGFASIHQAIGGVAYITGYPDDGPSASGGDADIMNATTAAFTVMAALYHREQTGEGQFIDYSQTEGVTSLMGELLLGYELNGEIPERMGNAHPWFAPHNVYRCWGVDRWVALEVHTDEEFVALCKVIGQPSLASDPRFATREARKRNEATLDKIIGQWTRQRDRDMVVNDFCKAGLAAAPSRNGRDLYADPHLRDRGAFVKVQHPELGELELVGLPWKMSESPIELKCAPMLGQDNDYVFGEILGLSRMEIDDLREREIIY